MSTVKRLISGSASAWARIAVTVISQVAVVPFFLSRWDIQTYGTWIAIQALVIVCSTLDRGHNDFLEYEFLKIGNGERKKIRTYLWSGVSIVAVIAVAELLLLSLFCLSGGVQFLVDGLSNSNNNFAHEVAWSIIVGWITWSVTNIAGLFARCLFGFGYFPRMGWWNVLLAIVGTLAPVIATVNKGGLLDASIWACCGSLIVLFFQFMDMTRLLKKEKINRDPANWKLGWKNYFTSLGLSIRYFLENFRQQGIRILLVPLSGAAALTAFATMRTGANVALQGLSTITNPMMPELMRFLREKNQEKTVATFDTIWLIVILMLIPFVIVLQGLVPSIFSAWTHGKVPFDPSLFAVLSLSVLVYALSQPATAIAIGNNLIKQQVIISCFTSAILITGLLFLIPVWGIFGAAVSLLASEIISAACFAWVASAWLTEHGLKWPRRSYILGLVSIIISAVAMFGIINFQSLYIPILILSVFPLFIVIRMYWRNMTGFAVVKMKTLAATATGVFKTFSVRMLMKK